MWWLLVAVAVLAVVYWKISRAHKYWVERGVKQGNPPFLVGENLWTMLKKQSFAEMVEMVYNISTNSRYVGFYQFLIPTLLVKDPDLIKQIAVKDFDHFIDHQVFLPEDADPLWSKNLFALTGKNWREMRTTLTPAFTGSKIKYMFSLISKSSEQFVEYFLNKDEDLITIEMKDSFTRFANDVIANTAFGIECNSLKDRNNEFYLMGKEATDFSGFWKSIKLFGYLLIPGFFKHFEVKFFSTKVANFFTGIIKTNIKSREKHNIVRPDLIHILMEARKHGVKNEELQPTDNESLFTFRESEASKSQKTDKLKITDEDITSQALIFFFAGFDSVSSSMCFMSYELGVNQDIQQRLIKEVDKTMALCKGELTCEVVTGMKYMDMVVSETLRKWPTTVASDRICTKPYTIEPQTPDEKPLFLEKDTVLWLPIFGLHRDPQHFPDPDRFDPERFSDENKEHIKPYTFLPFGCGPRNCIGSRFALLETKVLFCHLLYHFQIVPVERTQIPLVICKKQFNLHAKDGFWFGLKRRCKT